MTFFFSAAAFPVGKRDEREKERVVMSLIRKKNTSFKTFSRLCLWIDESNSVIQ